MRLSTAMALGRNLCSMEAGNWNSCALGVAGTAVGVPQARVIQFKGSVAIGEHPSLYNLYEMEDGDSRSSAIVEKFPWLYSTGNKGKNWMKILYTLFDDAVTKGSMTFEQLVDYVHSVEPDCETCCKFECSCPVEEPVRKMDTSVEVMA